MNFSKGGTLEIFHTVVIPQVGHVKSAGRYCGAGSGAVTGIQDGADLGRFDFSFRRINHGTCHGTGHVIKEAICADPQTDPYNYTVYQIANSLNSITYAIRGVDVS